MKIKKKWKKILAMALVVLMISSVMDYSGFLSVSAKNLSETEIQNNIDIPNDTNSVSGDEKSESEESTVEEPEAQENGTEEVTEEVLDSSVEKATEKSIEETAVAGDDEASVTSGETTTGYHTIEAAITAAQNMSDSTVMLLKDVQTENQVLITSGTFTIDLNGKTWNSTVTDKASLTLAGTLNVTLKDSGTGGKITSASTATVYVNMGSVTIENGIYENTGSGGYAMYVIDENDLSKIVAIKGGIFQNKNTEKCFYIRALSHYIKESNNVSISGGTFDSIRAGTIDINFKNVTDWLVNGYAYRSTKIGNAWVDNGNIFENVTVQAIPVKIIAHPEAITVIYDSATAPTLSVKAVTVPADSLKTISYQWYRVKSGEETKDVPVGTNSSSYNVSTGDISNSYYCAVTCDDYTVNSEITAVKNAEASLTESNGTMHFYDTLEKAINDAQNMIGSIVTLLDNVTTENQVKIESGTLTIDLNGKTWISTENSYNALRLSNTSNVTLKDSGTGGKLTSTAKITVYVEGVSTTIEGGTYDNTEYYPALKVYNVNAPGKMVTIKGGTFQSKDEDSVYIYKSNISIFGGTFNDNVTMSRNSQGTFTGGTYKKIYFESGYYVKDLLADGYAFRSTQTGNAWVDNGNVSTLENVTVQAIPVKIIKQPEKSLTAIYGYTTASTLSLNAVTVPVDSLKTISYQWYRVKSGDETKDMAVGANSSSYTIPKSLGVGTYNYYCNVSCDGYTMNATDTILFTVNKATPNITMNSSISGNKGNRSVTLTATIAGVGDGEIPTCTIRFVNCTGENEVVITESTISTDGKVVYEWKGMEDQSYKVKAVYKGSDNYNSVTSGKSTFDTSKQNQAPLTIDDISPKTYGDSAFILTTTGGSGTGAVTFTSSDPKIVSISGNTVTVHKVGTVTIKATKEADENYNDTSAKDSLLTIKRKSLIIKADDKRNVIKGSTMPEFTYTVTGLVDGDTFESPTISAIADDTGNAANIDTIGRYSITISGGTLANADNYEVKYLKGTMIIINGNFVTVINGAVTNGTGDTSYIVGQTVSVTANSRNGYTFSEWTSNDNVKFVDSNATTTTFIMPGKPVTVSANYSMDDHYLIDKDTAAEFGEADKKGYATITLKKTSYVYTGSEIRPVPVVSFTYTEYDDTGKQTGKAKTKKLVENVDYTLSYTNNSKVGTVLSLGKILITGIGDYKGTMTKEFTITPKSIKSAVIEPIQDVKATGADLKPYMDGIIIVKDGVNTVSTNDYDITYQVNGDVQTALTGNEANPTLVTVSVTGKNNYKDAIKKTQTFTILPKNSTATSVGNDFFTLDLKAPDKSYVYSGKAIKPKITVSAKGTKVKLNKDYKISYDHNVNAGTGTITVSGKNNYYGSKSITFKIQPKEMKKVKVKTLSKLSFRESMEDLELTITDGGRYLKKGEDYTVDFSSSKDLGLGKLKVKKFTLSVNAVAGSNYKGKKEVSCYIIPRSLTNKITTKIECPNIAYSESIKNDGATPVPVIHYNSYQLRLGEDFKIVKYTCNKNIGTGKVIIQGIGNYAGKRTVKFQITN